MLKTALEYAARGWHVFPLHSIVAGECTCGKPKCSDAGKHPRVDGGLKAGSIDTDTITGWFGPDSAPSNIGVVTGKISGITVVDIDIGDGKLGAESWAKAIGEHGEPDTLMAETGSGGAHVIFKYFSGHKTAGNVLGPGVDIRNDGGYIVAAPSNHRSGGKYSWLNPGTAVDHLPEHLSKRVVKPRKNKAKGSGRRKFGLSEVESMLEHVPSTDRDMWLNVGIILGRTYNRSDEAWELYQAWAAKGEGGKGRGHDERMRDAFFNRSGEESTSKLGVGTIVKAALEEGWAPSGGMVPIDHFLFYGPSNTFIYRPTRTHWIAPAVDAAVAPENDGGAIIKASDVLRVKHLVTSLTVDPLIADGVTEGVDCLDGELVDTPGGALYNTYRRPTIEPGDAKLAQPFVDHVRRCMDKAGDADQFLNYMTHRVQVPGEKPRFALLIAGGQGVGKDTAIEMCVPAIGSWNVANIEASAFDQAFNEFAAATLIRISEAANTKEMSKWAFNERTKVLIAGQPDAVAVNPKYGHKFSIRMHCGVILTTNHLTTGLYIPQDDRRYDVIDCATLKDMGLENESTKRAYFEGLWSWFREGGANHVAAFLADRDISMFSAATGQRKTAAHQTVVMGGMSGDQWLADIIEELGDHFALRSDWVESRAMREGDSLRDIRRKLVPSLLRLGYSQLHNQGNRMGRWLINKKRVMVFVNDQAPANFNPQRELTKEPNEQL